MNRKCCDTCRCRGACRTCLRLWAQDKDGGENRRRAKNRHYFRVYRPIEPLTPDMALGAELAISEANESGNFALGAATSVRAD